MGGLWKKNRLDSIFAQWRGDLKIVEAIADTIFAPKGSSEWFAQLESKRFFFQRPPTQPVSFNVFAQIKKSPDFSEDFLIIFYILARWLSWLERRPVTAEVVGSIPIRVARLCLKSIIWDHSSAGRASALQAEGHRFESYWSHLYAR